MRQQPQERADSVTNGLDERAAEVEVAARALLTLSARASLAVSGAASLTQLRALAAVEEAGPCSLGNLADALTISVSSASRLVDRMVTAALIDRQPAGHSRREVVLTVTTHGRRLLRRHERARRAVFADVLGDMPKTEVRALLTGLRAVQRQLDRHRDSARTR